MMPQGGTARKRHVPLFTANRCEVLSRAGRPSTVRLLESELSAGINAIPLGVASLESLAVSDTVVVTRAVVVVVAAIGGSIPPVTIGVVAVAVVRVLAALLETVAVAAV